jgi:polysaccharide biosynthesis/export protein
MNDHVLAAVESSGPWMLNHRKGSCNAERMTIYRILLSTLVLSAVTALGAFAQASAKSGSPAIAAAAVVDERYRIGFRDVLEIQVDKHADLNQRVSVGPAGTISLFRLERPVAAACKTETELSDEIAAAYRENYLKNPRVRVTVAEQKSQSVAVIGAVATPGNFFIGRRMHLLELLALAGGPSKEAGTRVLVARTGSTADCKQSNEKGNGDDVAVVAVKMKDLQEMKRTIWMQPGDVVSVLEADQIYVYGNVNKQGAYPVREPITLTQALVTAEGLRPAAKKDKVRVLRQKPDGLEREELVFDLNQIDKGKVKDPFLEPNDIVAVSEDRTKAILQGIGNSIKSSLPSALYRFP